MESVISPSTTRPMGTRFTPMSSRMNQNALPCGRRRRDGTPE